MAFKSSVARWERRGRGGGQATLYFPMWRRWSEGSRHDGERPTVAVVACPRLDIHDGAGGPGGPLWFTWAEWPLGLYCCE
jgi:hypothetical protein